MGFPKGYSGVEWIRVSQDKGAILEEAVTFPSLDVTHTKMSDHEGKQ